MNIPRSLNQGTYKYKLLVNTILLADRPKLRDNSCGRRALTLGDIIKLACWENWGRFPPWAGKPHMKEGSARVEVCINFARLLKLLERNR